MNLINEIIGKSFYNWNIIEKTNEKNKSGSYLYKIKCNCGFETLKTKNNITSGKSRMCITCHNKLISSSLFEKNKLKNIGKKFGKYEIIDRVKEDGKWNYVAKCQCGKEKRSHRVSDFSRFTGCTICCDKKIDLEKRRKMYLQKAKKRIGLIVGSFKILDIDFVKNQLIYMKCKCLFCKKKTSIPNGSISFRESCGCLREKHKARGQNQHASKLTNNDAIAIRDLHKSGCYSLTEISKQFGVSLSCCSSIIHNKTWNHV